jgi:segregation and condensation protein B
MKLSIDKYSALIEAILFCENDVVRFEKIIKITGLEREKITEIVAELMIEYNKENHGIMISEVADGYTFQLKREIIPDIKEFYQIKNENKLSKSILTVLSIIAYKQPVTKAEVEQFKGSAADTAIKRLLELNLIKITGRKEAFGKPLLYGTTDDFLKYFNLKSIEDLPKIGELKSDEFTNDE